jgi:hypothetical protein
MRRDKRRVPLERAVTCHDGSSVFVAHILAPPDYRTPAVSIKERRRLYALSIRMVGKRRRVGILSTVLQHPRFYVFIFIVTKVPNPPYNTFLS